MLLMYAYPTGGRVKIINNGNVVDEAIVLSVAEGPNLRWIEVEGKHEKTKFALFDESKNEWKMLFNDPFTNILCYSERGPIYSFEVIWIC